MCPDHARAHPMHSSTPLMHTKPPISGSHAQQIGFHAHPCTPKRPCFPVGCGVFLCDVPRSRPRVAKLFIQSCENRKVVRLGDIQPCPICRMPRLSCPICGSDGELPDFGILSTKAENPASRFARIWTISGWGGTTIPLELAFFAVPRNSNPARSWAPKPRISRPPDHKASWIPCCKISVLGFTGKAQRTNEQEGSFFKKLFIIMKLY